MPDPDPFLRWALDLMARWNATDADAPVFTASHAAAQELGAEDLELIRSFPETAADGDELRDRLTELLGRHVSNARTPRFQNQLFSGVHEEAMAGFMAGLFSNATMSTREVAPLATEVERAVISWLVRLVRWDADDAGGTATPAGSFSNYLAVYLARKRATALHGDEIVPRLAAFTSADGHYSVAKGADLAGMPRGNVFHVPTDDSGRMRAEALGHAIDEARDKGLTPFLVNATLGTTVAGALDPVPEIAAVAAAHGMWLHVDAAWGGLGLCGSEADRFLGGLDRADSVTWDAHKGSAAPLALSFLLTRDRSVLDDLRPPRGGGYLFQDPDAPADEADLGLTSLYCGKPFLSLALWLLWKAKGLEGIRARVDRATDLTARLRERIAESPYYELAQEPETWVVCFRPKAPDGASAAEREDLAQRARERIVADGRWLIRLCPLRGENVFRAILVNPLMNEDLVDELVAHLEACHPHADSTVSTSE